MADVLDDDKPANKRPPVSQGASEPESASSTPPSVTNGAPGKTTPPPGPPPSPPPKPPSGARPWEPKLRSRFQRRMRRTWPQRLLLGLNSVLVLACIATAAGLWYGYNGIAEKINRIIISEQPETQAPILFDPNGNVIAFSDVDVDLLPENFLIVGNDSRACQPDNPQYAGAFGGEGGDNTDTMMLVRLDPVAKQAAILSFPRDLWVENPGGGHSRINDLFDPLNPNVLVETIRENFGVPVHHYIGIDFCGFRDLVNAVGGVKIPFAYPARDRHTGLEVLEPGCVEFDGDAALAYARSRYYEWQDEDGDWNEDQTFDYGRVARQQDFVRRVLRKAVDRGATSTSGLRSMITLATEHITLDQDLAAQDLYDWGRALRDVPPEAVRSFTIAGRDALIGDADVQQFDIDDPVNADVVKVFSGQARLGAEPPPEEAAAPGPGDAVAVPAAQPDDTAPPSSDPAATVPEVSPSSTNDRNAESIVPPDDPSCT